MKKHIFLAVLAALVLALPSYAQRGDRLPDLPQLPDPEDRCDDPVHLALEALEPGQVVKEFEGENDKLSYDVQVVYISLETTDCDNYVGTFEVRWVIDFKGDLDDVVLDHYGTLLVEKDLGEYSTAFFAENSKDGEGELGPLHLEYHAAYEVSAEMPFDLAVDEEGNLALVPGAIDLLVHVEVSGKATESVDDAYMSLEGNVAAAADLALRIVPLGEEAFSYEGELAWAWAADVTGYIQYRKFRRNVDQHKEGSGSLPLAGETSVAQIKAALAALRSKVEEILAALE